MNYAAKDKNYVKGIGYLLHHSQFVFRRSFLNLSDKHLNLRRIRVCNRVSDVISRQNTILADDVLLVNFSLICENVVSSEKRRW